MSEINDCGAAFPQVGEEYDNGRWRVTTDASGMTLRDYFAANAVVAIGSMVATGTHSFDGDRAEALSQYARDAYELADAMLQAREA